MKLTFGDICAQAVGLLGTNCIEYAGLYDASDDVLYKDFRM